MQVLKAEISRIIAFPVLAIQRGLSEALWNSVGHGSAGDGAVAFRDSLAHAEYCQVPPNTEPSSIFDVRQSLWFLYNNSYIAIN